MSGSGEAEEPERRFDPAQALRRLAVPVALGLVVYAALGFWSGFGALRQALTELSPGRLLAIVGVVLVGWGLRAARWHYYGRRLELGVPWPSSLLVFAASFAFTATPGKAGEVVKSVLLRNRFGIPMATTAAALLVERVTDLLAVLALSLGGLGRADMRPYFLLAFVLLATAVLFLGLAPIHRATIRWLSRIDRLRRPASTLERLLSSGRRLLTPGAAAIGLLLALLAWSCEALALYWILRELGVDASWGSSAAVFGLATLVGAFSMLPGGVGGFEATAVLLLRGLGASTATAVAATLLIRLVTLWLVSALGGGFLVLWWRRSRRGAGERS